MREYAAVGVDLNVRTASTVRLADVVEANDGTAVHLGGQAVGRMFDCKPFSKGIQPALEVQAERRQRLVTDEQDHVILRTDYESVTAI